MSKNKSIKLLSLLSLVWLLTSCQSNLAIKNQTPLQRFISDFSNELTVQRDFTFTGSYEAGDPKVNEISLYYSVNRQATLEQARLGVTSLIRQFVISINNDLEVKPQLEDDQFKAKQLDLGIFLRDKEGNYNPPPYIALVTYQKGILKYYTYEDEAFHLIHEESFKNVKR